MADHGDYGVFLRRTIDHGIDGGGAGSAAAVGWRRCGIGDAEGGTMVEAVATKDALLAAWIGHCRMNIPEAS